MRVHVLATILLLPACGGSPPPPEAAAAPQEPEPVVVTRWTDKTELFLEYPPLQAGETSRFRGPPDRLEFVSTLEGRACCRALGLWRRLQREICRGRPFTAWDFWRQCHPHAARNTSDDCSSSIAGRRRLP